MNEGGSYMSVMRSLLTAKFLLPVFVLVLSAVGLRPVMCALSDYYQKEKIATQKPLKEFDITRLLSFQDGWKITSRTLSAKAVGTDECLYLEILREQSNKKPRKVDLFVTYYSDPQDKVPHTPDVCFRQAGAIVEKMSTIVLDVPELADQHQKIEARLLLLKEPKRNIVDIFLFCVEGKLRYSREQVRWILSKPGNRYVYFSKIEAGSYYPLNSEPTEAIEAAKTALCEALPVLLKEHFPTKEQLKRR
ncbi:MAG: hypothetical protein KAS75_07655 [Planctomycetes bacterium]|nr:hypothetical protein [Planctomycetota bacterium]